MAISLKTEKAIKKAMEIKPHEFVCGEVLFKKNGNHVISFWNEDRILTARFTLRQIIAKQYKRAKVKK